MSRPGDPPDDVEPHVFGAPLGVCLTVVHPLAYLAFGPVRSLAADLAVAVEWLPFPAPPLKPPPGLDDVAAGAAGAADRGTRHRIARARYQASEITRYAEAQGLTVRDPFRQADPVPSCLGHLWLWRHAPQRVPEFLDTLFQGHWAGTMNAADPAAVAGAVAAVAGGRAAFEAFAAGPGPGQLDELRRRLVAAGVFTVPSLVVDGEVFVGRAHLPTVGGRLGGTRGPASR